VLGWRLDHTSLHGGQDRPPPWLPGIPDRIAAHPYGGHILAGRSHLIAELTDQVRLNVAGKAPPWAAKRRAAVPAELIADIQVWRAATQVDPSDLRPTGPLQLGRASRVFQQQLESDSPPRTPTQSHTGGNCSRRKSPA
jgi:hypothetical protein